MFCSEQVEILGYIYKIFVYVTNHPPGLDKEHLKGWVYLYYSITIYVNAKSKTKQIYIFSIFLRADNFKMLKS